jgi:hypothetical protein
MGSLASHARLGVSARGSLSCSGRRLVDTSAVEPSTSVRFEDGHAVGDRANEGEVVRDEQGEAVALAQLVRSTIAACTGCVERGGDLVANRTSGSAASARAIATRWRSPQRLRG